jgi:hypothetical protein
VGLAGVRRHHYVKTSNRLCNICNRPLTSVTSTHICNGCCLASVTYKRARMTPGLASTTPVMLVRKVVPGRPRAKRRITRGGVIPSSEAEICPRGRLPLE